MNICVYCGSRPGRTTDHADAARQLGTRLGEGRHTLVYGGGHVGLMGIVADATLAAGGAVVGVIPESLMRREVGHRHLTELHVVPDMHVRKRMMAERADAFLALPGGIGTMEELFEVWTWRQLGYHDRPIGLLNVGGYYDSLLAFLDRTVEDGFLDIAQRHVPLVDTDPDRLLDRLIATAQSRGPETSAPGDFDRI